MAVYLTGQTEPPHLDGANRKASEGLRLHDRPYGTRKQLDHRPLRPPQDAEQRVKHGAGAACNPSVDRRREGAAVRRPLQGLDERTKTVTPGPSHRGCIESEQLRHVEPVEEHRSLMGKPKTPGGIKAKRLDEDDRLTIERSAAQCADADANIARHRRLLPSAHRAPIHQQSRVNGADIHHRDVPQLALVGVAVLGPTRGTPALVMHKKSVRRQTAETGEPKQRAAAQVGPPRHARKPGDRRAGRRTGTIHGARTDKERLGEHRRGLELAEQVARWDEERVAETLEIATQALGIRGVESGGPEPCEPRAGSRRTSDEGELPAGWSAPCHRAADQRSKTVQPSRARSMAAAATPRCLHCSPSASRASTASEKLR